MKTAKIEVKKHEGIILTQNSNSISELATLSQPEATSINESSPDRVNPERQERFVGELTPHPLNATIYGEEIGKDIVESLKSGIIEPLLITRENTIVSGHRRWRAAQKRGLKKLPVRILPETDANVIERLLIESNVQRRKTTEQKLREFEYHLKLEAQVAKKRKGIRSDILKISSGGDIGTARDIAGKKVGISGAHAEKGLKALHAIDAHCTGETESQAERIRKVLNEDGIEAAHRECVESLWIASPSEKNKPLSNASVNSGHETPVAFAPPDSGQVPATAEVPEDEGAGDSQEKPVENRKPAKAPIAVDVILTAIQRDVVRGLTGFGLVALRQFQTELNAFKVGWLSRQEKEVSHV